MNNPISTEMNQTLPPQLPIMGAIFDLDGVLTDTSELHFRAWKKLADEEKVLFTRKDNEALRGISRRESLLLILKDKVVSETYLQEMMARKNRYYIDSISTLTPKDLLPGSQELLENLRKEGIKIALGSASKNARSVIGSLGIEHFFDAVADGESVLNQKPAPDLFLYASKMIGIPSSNCVVFEDAAAGIEAALVAGMWAVGIGPQMRLPSAHMVFNNLEGITLKILSTLLTRVSDLQTHLSTENIH